MTPRLLALVPLLAACSGPASTDSGASTGARPGGSDPGGACGPGAERGLAVGQCAPDFTLPDAAGRPFKLSDQRGKVALVDISAVW